MHINDRILELVRKHNDTDLNNVSLATLCLYKTFNSPLLKDKIKNINIIKKNTNFFITKGYNTEQDLRGCESHFESALKEDYYTKEQWIEKIKKDEEKLKQKKSSQSSAEDYDDYDYYYYEEDNYDENKITYIEKDRALAYEKFKNIFINNIDYRDVVNEVIKELNIDPFFLIKVASSDDNNREDLGLKTLKCLLHLPKEMIEDSSYDIDLFFENSQENIILKKINYDGFYMRDVLSAPFMYPNMDYKDKKERLNEIIKSIYDFNRFINLYAPETRKEIKNDLELEEQKEVIKHLIKNNQLVKDYFTKDFDFLFEKILDKTWPKIRLDILEGFNKVKHNIIEDLIYPKYEKSISKILNELYKDYPFLLEDKINQENIKFEVMACEIEENGAGFNKMKTYDIKQKSEIEKYFRFSSHNVDVLDLKNPTISELKKYESLSEKKDNLLLDNFFKTNFSLNSKDLGRFDGFKLFKKRDNYFYKSKNLFLIRMTYNNMLIGMAKVSQNKDYVYNSQTTEVIKPFQGQGLGYKMYDFIAEFISNNNLLLYSDHYTTEGRNYIPKIKNSLSKKYQNFLYVEADYHTDDINILTNPSNLFASIFGKYGVINELLPFKKIKEIKAEFLNKKELIMSKTETALINNEIDHYDLNRFIENQALEIIKSITENKKERKIRNKL